MVPNLYSKVTVYVRGNENNRQFSGKHLYSLHETRSTFLEYEIYLFIPI